MRNVEQKGFTLIELMIVLALLAIVTTIALPSFNQMIRTNKLQAQSNELESFLQYARSQAVAGRRSFEVNIDTALWTAKPVAGDSDLERVFEPSKDLQIRQNFQDQKIIFTPNGTASRGAVVMCINDKADEGFTIEVIPSGLVKVHPRGTVDSKPMTTCNVN